MTDVYASEMITKQQADEVLLYCPETGIFTWKVARGRQRAGSVAGTLKDGYINIKCIHGIVRAHRMAYLVMTGAWPPRGMFMDHINRDRSDNRWSNLRLSTISENTCNASIRSDSTTGYTGIYAHKTNGRFYVSIQKSGVVKKLGGYATIEEAAAVRRAAEIELFGAFAPQETH